MAHIYLICESPSPAVQDEFVEIMTSYVRALSEAASPSGLMLEVDAPARYIAAGIYEFNQFYPEVRVLGTSPKGGHA